MKSSQLFKRLLSYSFRYWVGFACAFLAMVIVAGSEAAFPALMKPLMDNGFQGLGKFEIWWVPVVILVIFALRGIAGFISTYSMIWVANHVLKDLRQAMFSKLITLPASYFDKSTSGVLISRLISESQVVLYAATTVITVVIRDSLILIGLFGWLIWLNWKLTLVVLVVVPPLIWTTLRFSSRLRFVSQSYLTSMGALTAKVSEAVSGNRLIKIFDAAAYEREKFAASNLSYRGQAMKLAVAGALQSPVSQMIAAFGVAVILTIALIQSRSGEATIGDFVSFITAMLMMLTPLKHLADINAQLQPGLAAAQNVFAVIDEQSEKDTGYVNIERARGSLEFKNVTLRYPGRDLFALKNLNLTLAAGSTIAFVGPSGSGKTSIVSLLPRFYEPTEGVILLDDIPLGEISLNSLRRQIALVSQDVVLFNDSIRANITYGRSDVTDEQIARACEIADLDSFINSLPKKLDTQVGDRGLNVSGGQRQRIAIARAVIKNAPILILDEATSALDSVSEASIQASVDRIRTGRTTIVISHKLSTLAIADEIVVLSGGEIVQRGKHDELVAQNGLYKELYEAGL